ncbi:MAG TPA: radical SAM protein [Blastocatellia bacterium]|nr:radical SAM protein [Blastocatellia bacterium]
MAAIPLKQILKARTVEGEIYDRLEGDRVRCYACGHRCLILPGLDGICRVRYNEGGRLMVPTGYVAALACDPTEKKPFFHAYPGSLALTFGMLGCDYHCSYCFAPSTRIGTTRGAIAFEKLFEQAERKEDLSDAEIAYPSDLSVYSHTGKVQKVRAIFRHEYHGKMLKIQAAFCPPVQCTPDHKLLAIRKPKSGRRPEEPAFIKAEELSRDHCLALPRNLPCDDDVILDVPELLWQQVSPSRMRREITGDLIEPLSAKTVQGISALCISEEVHRSSSWVRFMQDNLRSGLWVLDDLAKYDGKLIIKNESVRFYNEHEPGIARGLPLDEKLATLLGYYCAEGNVWQDVARRAHSGMLTFSFGLHETAYAEKVKRLIKEVFGLEATITKRSTTLAVVLYKSSVALLFASLCGIGSGNKYVPDQLFQAPPDVIEAFLTAYAEGDGHRERNGLISTATKSEELAYGVALLVLKTGRVPALRRYTIPKEGKLQGRTIHRSPTQFLIRWFDNPEKRRCWKSENHFFVPIRSIEAEDYDGYVYNMEVEEDHSYLANFLAVANCQNWISSQSLRDPNAIAPPRDVTPQQLVEAARRYQARLVVSSYNEPLITSEWAVEVFKQAKPQGFVCGYVSNGNATPEVLDYIRPWTELYKIDLKGFNDRNYRKLGGLLENVLNTIKLVYERGFWLEVVTLIIPGFNDSDDELKAAADFIAGVSPDIPWHVTAFHQDYKMTGPDNTSVETLIRAAEIGYGAGLKFVYAGNLPGRVGGYENTYCPGCKAMLIERYGFRILKNRIRDGSCPDCHAQIPGRWD